MLPTHQRAVVALAVSFILATAGAAAPATAAPPSGVATATVTVAAAAATTPEKQVFALINKQRTAKKLAALVGQKQLDAAAEAWAKHLATTGTFAHSSSTWRLSKIGLYGWKSSGENLAAGYTTAAAAVTAWMKSAGHKANILGKTYKGMGVGYYSGGPYRHYWVVIFAVADPPMPKGKTPTVSGAAKAGSTLKASTSGWPSGTTLAWQWYRNGSAISGATASAYRATATDTGKSLQAKVWAFNKKYYYTSSTSARTRLVAV